MKNKLNKEEIEYVIYLLSLVDKVGEKYDSFDYEKGVRGLVKGLEKYIEGDMDTKLDAYLTYFIKEAYEKGEEHCFDGWGNEIPCPEPVEDKESVR